LTDEEAREYLSELRDREARQQRELKIVNQKDRIRKDYLQAIEALMDHDIKEMLTEMSEKRRASFRRLLFLIFNPNSLQVSITGSGNQWKASIVGYEFTEEFASLLPDKAVNQDTRRSVGQPFQAHHL